MHLCLQEVCCMRCSSPVGSSPPLLSGLVPLLFHTARRRTPPSWCPGRLCWSSMLTVSMLPRIADAVSLGHIFNITKYLWSPYLVSTLLRACALRLPTPSPGLAMYLVQKLLHKKNRASPYVGCDPRFYCSYAGHRPPRHGTSR